MRVAYPTGLLVVFVCLATGWSVPGACAGKKPTVVPSEEALEVTTLRAGRPAHLATGRGGQRDLRYLSVEVVNIGSVAAKDVQVSIGGSSGLSFPLRGPKKLQPSARGVYVSTVRVPAGVVLKGHATVTCSTCRR